MKKYLIYFGFLFLIMILLYQLKITLGKNDLSKTNLSANPITEAFIAEIEILNGCGESGIANLYANFLRQQGFDVIESKNADNFDYLNTNILVHKKEMMPIAKNLAKILKIKEIQFNKKGMWDLSLIIGKDYKKLDSFETLKKHYSPF